MSFENSHPLLKDRDLFHGDQYSLVFALDGVFSWEHEHGNTDIQDVHPLADGRGVPQEKFNLEGFKQWALEDCQEQRWAISQLTVSAEQCRVAASWYDLECQVEWGSCKLELRNCPMDLQQFVRACLRHDWTPHLAMLGETMARILPWETMCTVVVFGSGETSPADADDIFFVFNFEITVEETKAMDLSDEMKMRLKKGLAQAEQSGFTWDADDDILTFPNGELHFC